MNDCKMSQTLSRYHDGELPPEDQQAFVEHLRQCAPCAAELEMLRAFGASLRAVVPPRASAEFLSRVDALAEWVEDVTIMPFVRRLTAVAAAVLIAATVHWALLRRAPAVQLSSGLSEQETALVDPDSAAVLATSDNASTEPQVDLLIQNLAGGRN